MKSLPLFLCALATGLTQPAVSAATADSPWRIADKAPARVELFDLADVRLAPGPFLDAQQRTAAYLLSLSADRLLHGFRKNAGLPPKAPHYGGWEARGLAGHSLGHYLSACAMMYSSTGDERFRERVAYIVAELAACQTPARGGLISGFPDDARVFAEVAAGDLRVQ
ncbi:MAG TPA: beta-L-arabinofuranosidase domain-containing protein, partial [Opitutus sp.]|nr:beta-L-arabinofuranosidase domain-containing protein [Opitutus sp.]